MKNPMDQSTIKRINRARILKVFRDHEIIQKKDLAEGLGLSITTVTTNTRQLIEEGLIEETGIAESTGGRKPVVFKFNKNARVSFGVEVTPRMVTLIMTNLVSEIMEMVKFSIEGMTLPQALKVIETQIDRLLENHEIEKQDCLGIGLALPGSVDDGQKLLLNSPNLHVSNFSFEGFEADCGIEVFTGNEANLAAFAEVILGTVKPIKNAVYVSITDGVGCGIISNGEVTKGFTNSAGEFGHMRVSDGPKVCSCGRTGCWELFSSERALIQGYNENAAHAISTLTEFFDAYAQKDHIAIELLNRYIAHLAIGIENILLGLDPEVIIIGGEMAVFLKSILSSEESKEHRLIFSEIAPLSAVLGSSLLPFKAMFGF